MENNFILSPLPLTEFEQLLRSIVKTELQSYTPAPSTQEQDELLTTNEARDLLRVSKVTIHKWKTEGKIKFYRIGTRVRFKRSELLSALTAPKKYGRKEK